MRSSELRAVSVFASVVLAIAGLGAVSGCGDRRDADGGTREEAADDSRERARRARQVAAAWDGAAATAAWRAGATTPWTTWSSHQRAASAPGTTKKGLQPPQFRSACGAARCRAGGWTGVRRRSFDDCGGPPRCLRRRPCCGRTGNHRQRGAVRLRQGPEQGRPLHQAGHVAAADGEAGPACGRPRRARRTRWTAHPRQVPALVLAELELSAEPNPRSVSRPVVVARRPR